MTNAILLGMSDAGNPQIRFDEGEVASCTAEASLRRVPCRRQPAVMTRPQVASRSEVARGLRASGCAATPRRGFQLYKLCKILGGANSIVALLVGFVLPLSSLAATTITVDSVVQRWPWNNKVDITYTVTDGQTLTADGTGDVYCKLVFNATVGGQVFEIDGVTNIGASASSGTHTVTWTPPADLRVKSTNCTMTATLLAADAPSGDDYMIIDLATGVVSYEGLLASQGNSNDRYNTDAYKRDKMVLRKVAKGGTYPTGDNVNYQARNSATNWTTALDYYIGVFPVTLSQYRAIYGSGSTGTKPKNSISWNALRLAETAPTSSIPAVVSNTGTFFQRLNYKTGMYFDLPTELMAEIAERAGATTTYYWGNSADEAYVVSKENSGNNVVAVGSRIPNAWGLYDMAGNVWEWCRDDTSRSNLANAADPFAPACAAASCRVLRCGGGYDGSYTGAGMRASNRKLDITPDICYANMGFRVTYIVK